MRRWSLLVPRMVPPATAGGHNRQPAAHVRQHCAVTASERYGSCTRVLWQQSTMAGPPPCHVSRHQARLCNSVCAHTHHCTRQQGTALPTKTKNQTAPFHQPTPGQTLQQGACAGGFAHTSTHSKVVAVCSQNRPSRFSAPACAHTRTPAHARLPPRTCKVDAVDLVARQHHWLGVTRPEAPHAVPAHRRSPRSTHMQPQRARVQCWCADAISSTAVCSSSCEALHWRHRVSLVCMFVSSG